MLIQGLSIVCLPFAFDYTLVITIMVLLSFGTALVYPTFLSAISVYAHPGQRAETIGIFRFWRDLGYAIGALVSGILADVFGLLSAILFIGVLTLISAFVILFRMPAD